MIEELLPAGVAVCSMEIREPAPDLVGDEQAAVADAVAHRRLEFATGRACARQALASLGEEQVAIPRGADRAPIWPPGIVGSISHSSTHCFAAVARDTDFFGLGIDVETNEPLDNDVLALVTTEVERSWLATKTDVEVCLDKLIFGAKECVYKVWYPAVGRWLGFEGAEVTIDSASGTFDAALLAPADRRDFAATLSGRFALVDGLLLTALAIPSKSGMA